MSVQARLGPGTVSSMSSLTRNAPYVPQPTQVTQATEVRAHALLAVNRRKKEMEKRERQARIRKKRAMIMQSLVQASQQRVEPSRYSHPVYSASVKVRSDSRRDDSSETRPSPSSFLDRSPTSPTPRTQISSILKENASKSAFQALKPSEISSTGVGVEENSRGEFDDVDDDLDYTTIRNLEPVWNSFAAIRNQPSVSARITSSAKVRSMKQSSIGPSQLDILDYSKKSGVVSPTSNAASKTISMMSTKSGLDTFSQREIGRPPTTLDNPSSSVLINSMSSSTFPTPSVSPLPTSSSSSSVSSSVSSSAGSPFLPSSSTSTASRKSFSSPILPSVLKENVKSISQALELLETSLSMSRHSNGNSSEEDVVGRLSALGSAIQGLISSSEEGRIKTDSERNFDLLEQRRRKSSNDRRGVGGVGVGHGGGGGGGGWPPSMMQFPLPANQPSFRGTSSISVSRRVRVANFIANCSNRPSLVTHICSVGCVLSLPFPDLVSGCSLALRLFRMMYKIETIGFDSQLAKSMITDNDFDEILPSAVGSPEESMNTDDASQQSDNGEHKSNIGDGGFVNHLQQQQQQLRSSYSLHRSKGATSHVTRNVETRLWDSISSLARTAILSYQRDQPLLLVYLIVRWTFLSFSLSASQTPPISLCMSWVCHLMEGCCNVVDSFPYKIDSISCVWESWNEIEEVAISQISRVLRSSIRDDGDNHHHPQLQPRSSSSSDDFAINEQVLSVLIIFNAFEVCLDFLRRCSNLWAPTDVRNVRSSLMSSIYRLKSSWLLQLQLPEPLCSSVQNIEEMIPKVISLLVETARFTEVMIAHEDDESEDYDQEMGGNGNDDVISNSSADDRDIEVDL